MIGKFPQIKPVNLFSTRIKKKYNNILQFPVVNSEKAGKKLGVWKVNTRRIKNQSS